MVLEPLNIVSDSYNNKNIGGPNKVFFNTIKGLEKIGQPYVLNKSPKLYKLNWIHDSVKFMLDVAFNKIPSVVGPNLFTLPNEIPSLLPNMDHITYLHPSQWPIDSWKVLGCKLKNLFPWPAGIDWETFDVVRNRYSKKVLVYLKKRDPALVQRSSEILSKRGLEPIVLEYGYYNEEEYIQILSQVKFGIWIGISESQGIGLQEALASNLPLIVLDVKSFWDQFPHPSYPFPRRLKNFKPTSAPYFNNDCGIIIESIDEMDESITFILDNYNNFSAKNFIISNLSLEISARKLINFFHTQRFDYSFKEKNQEQHMLITLAYLEYKFRNKIKTIKSILHR